MQSRSSKYALTLGQLRHSLEGKVFVLLLLSCANVAGSSSCILYEASLTGMIVCLGVILNVTRNGNVCVCARVFVYRYNFRLNVILHSIIYLHSVQKRRAGSFLHGVMGWAFDSRLCPVYIKVTCSAHSRNQNPKQTLARRENMSTDNVGE